MAKVVYWSQTGNTQTMAEAVAKGITAAGGSAECVAVSDITPQDLAGEAVFALGCPAMGAEVLEERMKAAGAEIVGGEGVICMEAPDDEAIAACEKLGSQLV